MCKKSSPSSVPTTSTTTTSIPPWLEEGGKKIVGIGGAAAEEPYLAYPGPRIAPFTADENAAFGMTRSNVGSFAPYLGAGAGYTEAAAQPWDMGAFERYSNPFSQGVTDINAREIRRQHNIGALDREAAASASGSFGGSRHGVIDAEAERNLQQVLADQQARDTYANYANAQQMFGIDQARSMQAGGALAGIGEAGSTLGYRDASALAAAGESQRAMDQENLNLAYQDWMNQFGRPWENLTNYAQLLGMAPSPTTQTTTGQQFYNQPNTFAQTLGALGSVAGGVGSLIAASDRNMKTIYGKTPGKSALAAVKAMPIYTWRYRGALDDGRIRVGPVAQDFGRHVMGSDGNDTTIDMITAQGTTMAAVKELAREVEALREAA